jgi:medium-chain acyl-[acyl-carrier-protein] hydrolase
MNSSQTRWFENLPEAGHAPRLYCFPYAGGSAQVFRQWQRHLSTAASLSLVHLPGRGARLGEPPFKHYKPLVNALADAISSQLPPAFAFWGHSMGALISFELARELRRRGQPVPFALFVSGRTAPQIPDPDPPTFHLPEQEFVAELRRLNGTPKELLDSPEFSQVFLPTIRADFELVETHSYEPEAPLACAIHAYGGLLDASVPAVSLRAWKEQTSGAFKVRMFPGDHFFVHTSQDLVHVLRRDILDLVERPADCRTTGQMQNVVRENG